MHRVYPHTTRLPPRRCADRLSALKQAEHVFSQHLSILLYLVTWSSALLLLSPTHESRSLPYLYCRQNPIKPGLFLELDGNHLKSLASQVLGQVFNGVEIHDVSSLRGAFFCFSVRICEPEMDVVQEHPDAGRMAVHDGLLVRSVANPQHAHAVVLHLHFVMLRVDADRVVGHRSSSVQESPQV